MVPDRILKLEMGQNYPELTLKEDQQAVANYTLLSIVGAKKQPPKTTPQNFPKHLSEIT